MKYGCLLVFSIIFFMACGTTYSMERGLTRLYMEYYEEIHKKRTLRDELLFAHTIIDRSDIPKDVAYLILQKSYHLKMRHSGMNSLNFKPLGEKAVVDFLYFTNEQASNFLKMCPRINKHSSCIELYTEDSSLDGHNLLEGLSKYAVRLMKPYDD